MSRDGKLSAPCRLALKGIPHGDHQEVRTRPYTLPNPTGVGCVASAPRRQDVANAEIRHGTDSFLTALPRRFGETAPVLLRRMQGKDAHRSLAYSLTGGRRAQRPRSSAARKAAAPSLVYRLEKTLGLVRSTERRPSESSAVHRGRVLDSPDDACAAAWRSLLCILDLWFLDRLLDSPPFLTLPSA
ncbi:uncharacterized protein TRAVEDRAFT_46781 [Trametes versicolor FP-101664 SS1]|uniref:uncharacterized protein n=1 Tax=Trametes versicolor (strain FP-101664) TaxID=717944 RepID=UPI0004624132|nr:uncharacterized protein TRAVEDRAFT_46781 [Trametes versicolor FP-101664 SS1]EIW59474.1 hypothetical protein TRAVEDRAFT_46781 [Trametes versicolor FP-101664 SS1]